MKGLKRGASSIDNRKKKNKISQTDLTGYAVAATTEASGATGSTASTTVLVTTLHDAPEAGLSARCATGPNERRGGRCVCVDGLGDAWWHAPLASDRHPGRTMQAEKGRGFREARAGRHAQQSTPTTTAEPAWRVSFPPFFPRFSSACPVASSASCCSASPFPDEQRVGWRTMISALTGEDGTESRNAPRPGRGEINSLTRLLFPAQFPAAALGG